MITDALSPDRALRMYMGSFIQTASLKDAVGLRGDRWEPGKPLKLLLACYTGTRNTGADVRVEEMIRQFRHILGDGNLALTIMTLDPELSADYFEGVQQILMPQVFPRFLYRECPKHHGVVACEGSMFKSKFAEALTTMMAGALGMAAAEDKLCVGYGAEAGAMSPSLKSFVAKHCKNALVICRNEPSRKVLEDMGIRTRGGTDTAWTFEPSPPERGAGLLRNAGWDGKKKVLIVCPINPFWWPVRPSLYKFAANRLAGRYGEQHYKSIYFHDWSGEAARKYNRYLDALATAVTAFRNEEDVLPVLVGMERLDRRACERLAERLDPKPPLFISDEHNMYDLVSILRNGSMMVSSRFHAIVCSMPAQVPSVGVTMDERIRNLMNDRGHADFFLEVDDPDLGDRLLALLRRMPRETDAIRDQIGCAVPGQLRLMGQMGIDFVDEVRRVYPEFTPPNLKRTWEDHLPPLPATVKRLLETYA
ncbi:MAG: polysaccharide pyruvyl transferase family protein [Pseudomonadota bacterium]